MLYITYFHEKWSVKYCLVIISLDPESPSHLSSISVPRPLLGVRSLLDRWYLSCQQTAWMVLVISTGGSISSMHTLTSSLGLWDTPKSKTFIDLTERNLSYLYIIYILSIIPNCFQLCVAAEYKRGWEGQIRMGRGRADPGADRQLDDNCWLTCCGCWLMESITLPTLIVIGRGVSWCGWGRLKKQY